MRGRRIRPRDPWADRAPDRGRALPRRRDFVPVSSGKNQGRHGCRLGARRRMARALGAHSRGATAREGFPTITDKRVGPISRRAIGSSRSPGARFWSAAPIGSLEARGVLMTGTTASIPDHHAAVRRRACRLWRQTEWCLLQRSAGRARISRAVPRLERRPTGRTPRYGYSSQRTGGRRCWSRSQRRRAISTTGGRWAGIVGRLAATIGRSGRGRHRPRSRLPRRD